MNIYLDIETIPGQDESIATAIMADVENEIKNLKPPGNYKKQETIDAWLAEENSKLVASFDDRFRKCSFDGGRGEIVSISFAIDDHSAFSKCRDKGTDEDELLAEFWDTLMIDTAANKHARYSDKVWIGHNIRAFDLPFLYKRCVINGIRPPLDVPFSSGPSDKRVFDTMTAWAGWGQRISQDALCDALKLPMKNIMTGADIYDYWLAKRFTEIGEYNQCDVETVRAIHKRMTFA